MRTFALLAVTLSACVPDLPLGKLNWADDLERTGGCGDIVLFAADEADTLMLRFDAEGVVAQAVDQGSELVVTFTFPTDEASLELSEGGRVSDATCDDVIENGGAEVDRSWLAVEGDAELTIVPLSDAEAWDTQGTATLVLTDVILENEDGEQVGLESFIIEDASVGWLPG